MPYGKPQSSIGWPVSATLTVSPATFLAPASHGISHYLTGLLVDPAASGNKMTICRSGSLGLVSGETFTQADNAALKPNSSDFLFDFNFKTSDSVASLFSKDDGADNKYILKLSSGKIQLIIGDGTDTATITGTASLSNSAWHHVLMGVVNRDGTNDTAVLYVDGVADSPTVSGTLTSVGAITGGTTDLTASTGILVYLGPFGIYIASSLTASTLVQDPYAFSGDETNLSAAWNFGEGTGATIESVVSGMGNASLVSSANWKTDDPLGEKDTLPALEEIPLTGKGDGCLEFPHPIKIGSGRGITLFGDPSTTLTVTVFGYTDSGS